MQGTSFFGQKLASMGRNRNSEGTVNQNKNFWIPNMKELMASTHQKANLVFPQFSPRLFLSLSNWKRKQTSYGPKKAVPPKSWKIYQKIHRFGIRWLMVWSHDQILTTKYVLICQKIKTNLNAFFFQRLAMIHLFFCLLFLESWRRVN